jgi:hypothetical protein
MQLNPNVVVLRARKLPTTFTFAAMLVPVETHTALVDNVRNKVTDSLAANSHALTNTAYPTSTKRNALVEMVCCRQQVEATAKMQLHILSFQPVQDTTSTRKRNSV